MKWKIKNRIKELTGNCLEATLQDINCLYREVGCYAPAIFNFMFSQVDSLLFFEMNRIDEPVDILTTPYFGPELERPDFRKNHMKFNIDEDAYSVTISTTSFVSDSRLVRLSSKIKVLQFRKNIFTGRVDIISSEYVIDQQFQI